MISMETGRKRYTFSTRIKRMLAELLMEIKSSGGEMGNMSISIPTGSMLTCRRNHLLVDPLLVLIEKGPADILSF